MRKIWDKFTIKFGYTIIHPEFMMLSFTKDAVNEILKYTENKKLIDIGCGNMPYRSLLEKNVKSYTGLDSPSTSKYYHPKIKPDIYADITKKIPIKNNEFEVALLLEVLEYIEDPVKTFREINRILKTKGIFAVTSVFLYPQMKVLSDRNRFTALQVKSILKTSGFKIIKVKSYGNFINFWMLSIILFLLKRSLDITTGHKTIISIILLCIFMLLILPLTLITNIFYLLCKNVKTKYNNYFPIDYLFVAIKE